MPPLHAGLCPICPAESPLVFPDRSLLFLQDRLLSYGPNRTLPEPDYGDIDSVIQVTQNDEHQGGVYRYL